MKKLLFSLVNKLGYRIVNKNSERELLALSLQKYKISNNFETLFQSKYYIQNLEKKFKNVTIINHKEGFLVGFHGYSIYIESNEEFYILNEIFIRNDYDFTTASKAVVIDIGANIGITSLFFSQFDFVEKIYAFEPVRDTFEQAEFNFSLNKKMHKVASIKNIGLGKSSRKEVFLFDKLWKGNAGFRGLESPSYSQNTTATEREVQIEDASLEFQAIVAANPGRKVVVKMDCEGGEYEIIEGLYSSGMIQCIDVLLLEWHDQGSHKLEKILLDSGFNFFSKNFDELTGMIYAYKNK